MKYPLFFLVLLVSSTLFAGDPVIPVTVTDSDTSSNPVKDGLLSDSTKFWSITTQGRLALNQASFTNWAEGGESNIAGNTYGNFKANYLKDKFKADNFLAVAYGLTWNEEQDVRKIDDKIDIGSTIGYEAFEYWFYSFMVNLKSQFSPGYKYPNDSTVVSRLFAPATLYISMGMEYKPDKNTSVFISPASGKFLFVMDQELANKGAFGVTPAVLDTLGNVLQPGHNYKSNFGINVVFNINRDLMKNVNMDTKLNLHNNYMDETLDNRWNFDVDWETAVNFKINSFLSSIIYLHLMYDHDIPIPTYEHVEGEKVQVGSGPKLQVKENFGIGVTIKV